MAAVARKLLARAVDAHRRAIVNKLALRSRSELVLRVAEGGRRR
jgi:hypothetical protein